MDIWAVGCIMAEIYNHPHPLFYGQNEKEVLNKICSILGTPNHDIWQEGIQQANLVGIKFPNNAGTDLANIIPSASPKAIDLMKQMLQWDPNRRPTAANLLNHPFFQNENENDNMANLNIDISRFFENFEKNNNNLTRNEKNRDSEFIKKSISLLKQSRGDDNNYLKLLNDTDGLVKLLSQLKKEKIQDDKEYEKEANKFGINDFDVSNINGNCGLDITNLSINKSNNLFNQSLKLNNNIFNSNNKSNNNIVDIDLSYNVTTIGNNTSLKNSGIKLDNKEEKDFNDIDNKININTSLNNDNNIDINEKKENNSEQKMDFNDYGLNFEVKLKKEPITNRIRSARKFLEENESKFNCDKPKIMHNGFGPSYKKEKINNGLIYKYNSDKETNNNQGDINYLNFGNTDSEFNKIFEKTRKKMGIVESDFIKKDYNYLKNNSKGFQFFNDKEALFVGSRRNNLNNNNNIWGIK
jgi:serine/threonine protein kinase